MERTGSPIDGSIEFQLGPRSVALVMNGRAARLILEELGIDVYREPHSLFQVDVKRLNFILWAVTQNKRNGETPAEWPTHDDVEEYLEPESVIEGVKALATTMTPKRSREALKNALTEAQQKVEEISSPTAASDPSAEPNSASTPPSSTT